MKPYTIEIDPEEVLDSQTHTEILQYLNDNSSLETSDLSLIMRGFILSEIIKAIMDDRYVHNPIAIYKGLGRRLKEEGII